MEDNKDQGLNVREKAKALVALLKDDERLKNERTRALKAKERFAQSTQGEDAFKLKDDPVLMMNVSGYHPDHHGSPIGSPGDDFQQSRLKPDIELARYVILNHPVVVSRLLRRSRDINQQIPGRLI